jgi:hypothetical protein
VRACVYIYVMGGKDSASFAYFWELCVQVCVWCVSVCVYVYVYVCICICV